MRKKRERERVLEMAEDIVDRIGTAQMAENYYTEYCYGKEYKYESLRISIYDEERHVKTLTLSIGGKTVLYYVYDTNKFATYISGSWIELIEAIYNELDSLEFDKNYNKEKYKEKEARLRDFEDTLKAFVEDCRYTGALEWYNEYFDTYGMKVVRKTKTIHTGTINEASGDFEGYDKVYFEVYDDGSKVLTFNSDKYDLFRFCGDYVEEFNPGYWMTLFETAIGEYKEYKENEARQIADDSANETLRRFRESRR